MGWMGGGVFRGGELGCGRGGAGECVSGWGGGVGGGDA